MLEASTSGRCSTSCSMRQKHLSNNISWPAQNRLTTSRPATPCAIPSLSSHSKQWAMRPTSIPFRGSNTAPRAPAPPPSAHTQGISGYTPATYISYSEDEAHVCRHTVSIEVDATAAECYAIWDDWCRLVDFLDLVGQIGLDPESPTMGLFQCFYRWGQMPVMEIVFVLEKTSCIVNEDIEFTTVWGLPLSGIVKFSPAAEGSKCKTLVTLTLAHQLPRLLVEMGVGRFGVEGQVTPILQQNLDTFKLLAEALSSNPASAPARQEASIDQAYSVSHLGPGAAEGVELTDDGDLAFFSNTPKTEVELKDYRIQQALLHRTQQQEEAAARAAASSDSQSGEEQESEGVETAEEGELRRQQQQQAQRAALFQQQQQQQPTDSSRSQTSSASSSTSQPARAAPARASSSSAAPTKRMGRPPGSSNLVQKSSSESSKATKPKVKRAPRMYDE